MNDLSDHDYRPRAVSDPLGPDGLPIPTATDHRWLWHIESVLAVNAPSGSHLDELRRALCRYLSESCQHYWRHTAADTDMEAFWQCLWCCRVVPQPENGEMVGPAS